MKNGDRVQSIFPEDAHNQPKYGTIITAQHKEASKNAKVGWLVKVKWDKSRATIYHEDFLKVITPLEEAML